MPKKKNNANTRTYSFTIDVDNPKYKKLVDFLENIDSGGRSFVIRQILNDYLDSNSFLPFKTFENGNKTMIVKEELMNPNNINNNTNFNNNFVPNVDNYNNNENNIIKTINIDTKEKDNLQNEKESKNEEDSSINHKKKIPPQLNALKNTFGID